MGYEDTGWVWLGVWSAAGVVAGVFVMRVVDGQEGLSFDSPVRGDVNPAPAFVVIDHAVIMVPKHVLWRTWAL